LIHARYIPLSNDMTLLKALTFRLPGMKFEVAKFVYPSVSGLHDFVFVYQLFSKLKAGTLASVYKLFALPFIFVV